MIRRQQDLNNLCRRNTQQAQARQTKKFNKKAAGAKAYSIGDYVWVFQNVIPPKDTKKLPMKWRGPFMITKILNHIAELRSLKILNHITIHRKLMYSWKHGGRLPGDGPCLQTQWERHQGKQRWE